MTVVRTDNWLKECRGDPLKVCEKLRKYFPTASASDIHHHLTMFGMYMSEKQGSELTKKLQNKNVWELLSIEIGLLRNKWKGPSVPIFIFPSDSDNGVLTREFKGKSGLAYEGKLFLFLSPHNTEIDMKALITHEYNHVCRLNKFSKRADDYTLLDTIILEGLAEAAVTERFGKAATSSWTSLYTDKQLSKIWKDFVNPNKHHVKESAIHEKILYGLGTCPHMAGYAVGYYLVRSFMKGKDLYVKDLFTLSSSEIAQLS